MAKKHLLYIHHPEFDKEKKKSDLVNELLARHYGSPVESAPEIADGLPHLCKHFAARGFCKKSACVHSQFNPKNRNNA